MSTKLYLKCPGNDPVSRAVPELFGCPCFGMGIEIWTDEINDRCISSNSVFRKYKIDEFTEKKACEQNVQAALEKLM